MPEHTAVAWYILRDGHSYGPFTTDDFVRFESEGQLAATDYVWYTGLDQWRLYKEYSSTGPPTTAVVPTNSVSRKCAPCLIVRKLLRLPYDTALTAFAVVARPTQFARQRIDIGPRDLYRASYFYLNLFTLAFLIAASLTHLDFYTGASQPRELANLALQIGLAVPLLYLCNFIARQTVTFSGIAQAVLYVDAIFIVFQTLLAGGVAYLSFSQALDRGELDVISTELERCLSNHSNVYWAIRGDLQFFYHTASDTPTLDVLRQYGQYALILPFCFVFAKLIKARYGASLWLNTIFAALAFAVVVNVTYYALNRVQATIAANSPCAETAARRAFATYNQALVVRQIAERVNGQLRKAFPATPPWVSTNAHGFLIDLQLRNTLAPTDLQNSISTLSAGSRSLYCQNNTDFRLARAIGVPLSVVIRHAGAHIVHQERITPATCIAAQ